MTSTMERSTTSTMEKLTTKRVLSSNKDFNFKQMNTGNQIVKTFKVDFVLDLWQEQSRQFHKESLFVKTEKPIFADH